MKSVMERFNLSQENSGRGFANLQCLIELIKKQFIEVKRRVNQKFK
jgi:hypothetical protein